MRKFFYSLVVMSMVSATTAAAQSRSEIEVLRAQVNTDRQAVVASNLPMTDAQASAFWPVYREYQAERVKLGDRMMKFLTTFAEKYDKLTNADAESMLKEFMEIQEAKTKVQSNYIGKFKKVLPAAKVARYYQIENKIDAIVNLELAAGVPLVPAKK